MDESPAAHSAAAAQPVRAGARPPSITVAAVLLVLEGILGGVAAIWSIVSTVTTGGYLPAALALAAIFALLAVAVGMAGRAVWRGHPWGRSVGMTWQVFLGLGAWALLQSGLTVAAVPVAAVAVLAIWGLVAPSSTAYLFPAPRVSDEDSDSADRPEA